MELIYTTDLCTGCNKCVRSCPVLTANIATQEGYVTVDPDKCIVCGECFDVCPHEARDYYDDTDRFFEDLASGKKISVILASAFLANYPKDYTEHGFDQRSGRKHEYQDTESVNDCRKYGRNFFPDDLCTEYDRRNAG